MKQNFYDTIDSGNFSVRDYLSLFQKCSVTHIHGLAVYVKEQIIFAWDLSLENTTDSYLCFHLASLQSLTSFSSINHLLCLNAQYLMLSRPTHLLICLSLQT